MAVLGCLLLGGCETVQEAYDSKLTLEEPVDWWHQLQGGEIAQQRPPPPGVADPYPNLGQIPARPTPTDPATRRALLAQLAGTRDRTKQEAAQEPIVWPVPDAPKVPAAQPASQPPTAAAPTQAAAPPAPSAPLPAPPAAAPAQNADSDVSTMVFEGATPAPAASVPQRRPAPDPNPPAAFAPAARPPARPPAVPGSAEPVVSGPVPALPAMAPPFPSLPGVPASTFAPATPRPRPSATFAFAPGSAVLAPSAEAALRALAGRRAGATIQVTAGGEARSAAPDAQAAALPLALRRTGAITAALIAAGVPAGSVRAEAVAPGRDGSARLVN